MSAPPCRRICDLADPLGTNISNKGRWIDNVFIERLWRTVKYEDVYLHAYPDGREAQQRGQSSSLGWPAKDTH
jgi:hypothetical protein